MDSSPSAKYLSSYSNLHLSHVTFHYLALFEKNSQNKKYKKKGIVNKKGNKKYSRTSSGETIFSEHKERHATCIKSALDRHREQGGYLTEKLKKGAI